MHNPSRLVLCWGDPLAPRRVGLIDDHPLYADALELLLSGTADLVWAGYAATVGGLLAIEGGVDLAILDLRLADGSLPQENVERLHAHGVQVLVYTSGEHPVLLRLAIKAEVLTPARRGLGHGQSVDVLVPERSR